MHNGVINFFLNPSYIGRVSFIFSVVISLNPTRFAGYTCMYSVYGLQIRVRNYYFSTKTNVVDDQRTVSM